MAAGSAHECSLAPALAKRLREGRDEITAHWLERIADRVTIEPNRIFPSKELLDHVPILVEGIASYLEDPAKEIGAEAPVVAKAMELGALRYAQGFDAYQILKEFEILGGILFSYLALAADEIAEPCEKSELLFCGQRLFKAVAAIQEATTTHYLRLADQRVAEREDRLHAFNRSISHEIRNRIGVVLGASEVLRETSELPPDQERLVSIISKNTRLMKAAVENLLALSLAEKDRQHRNVLLADAAHEAIRQVRELAADAGVDLRLGDLPDIEVNAAAVEPSTPTPSVGIVTRRSAARSTHGQTAPPKSPSACATTAAASRCANATGSSDGFSARKAQSKRAWMGPDSGSASCVRRRNRSAAAHGRSSPTADPCSHSRYPMAEGARATNISPFGCGERGS
jgi:hypothetical protein